MSTTIDERIASLTKRLEVMESEIQDITQEDDQLSEKIMKFLVDGGNASKLMEQQEQVRRKMSANRDALHYGKRQLSELQNEKNAAKVEAFQAALQDFDRLLLACIDDLKPIVEKYSGSLPAAWRDLNNQYMGPANIGHTVNSHLYPAIQEQVMQRLSFYFEPNALPAELEYISKHHSEWLKSTRKAK